MLLKVNFRFWTPQHWFNGITSLGPTSLHTITSIVIYVIILFFVLKLLKIAMTLCKCCTKTTEFITSCIPDPKEKEQKDKKKTRVNKREEEDEGVYV